MDRRRFITISAAALVATQARASTVRWHGRAMGAEVSLTLDGGTQADLDAAVAEIARMEKLFSIYDETSELSQINRTGSGALSAESAELFALCDQVHRSTGGLFDPTIQPVFKAALAQQALPWHLVGWDQVTLEPDHIRLGTDQELTLNGIAQGYATDRVRDLLVGRGFTKALVSVGEHAAIGGPFRLGLEDPVHGPVGARTLQDGAIATSSPGAMRLGAGTHILNPRGGAARHWSTVMVEAKSAAMADGLSTALCLASRAQIEGIAEATGTRVTLIDREGDVSRVG
ncbi:MAG: FAD:protein FMN transferase [Pseudomonadota bacterium]